MLFIRSKVRESKSDKVFKGNESVATFIQSIERIIDSTIYSECLEGSKSNQLKRIVRKILDDFPLLLTGKEISKRATDLISTYSITHGLLLADSLTDATALENDLPILA